MRVYGSSAGNFREGLHHWKNRSGIGFRKTGLCYDHLNLSIDISSLLVLCCSGWIWMKGTKLDCRFLNYGYTADSTRYYLLTVILLRVEVPVLQDDGLSLFDVVILVQGPYLDPCKETTSHLTPARPFSHL